MCLLNNKIKELSKMKDSKCMCYKSLNYFRKLEDQIFKKFQFLVVKGTKYMNRTLQILNLTKKSVLYYSWCSNISSLIRLLAEN